MIEPTFKNGEVLWQWGGDSTETVSLFNIYTPTIITITDDGGNEALVHKDDIEPLIQCLQAALNHVKSD